MPDEPSSANGDPAIASVEKMRRAMTELDRRIGELAELDPVKASATDVYVLQNSIKRTLQRIFGAKSEDFARYSPAAKLDFGPTRVWQGGRYAYPMPRTDYVKAGCERAIRLLTAAYSELAERIEEMELETPRRVASRDPTNRRVFLVHGHDHEALQTVARTLEKLAFEPVILKEMASGGASTIIEKFERHSDVGFAVVLLTPDDVGGKAGGDLRPRARQNVVLELGYFIGKLTRSHVFPLMRGRNVEPPSDIHGIVWNYWDEAWQLKLAMELSGAGYDVDLNLLKTT